MNLVTVIYLGLHVFISVAGTGNHDLQSLWKKMETYETEMTEKTNEMKKMKEEISLLKEEVGSLRSWKAQYETDVLSVGNPRDRRLLAPQVDQSRVAFSTYRSKSFSAVAFGTSREIVYDKIECNIGSGYDNYTGSFRAPVSGTYAFTWTFCAAGDGGELGIDLMVNNRVHGSVYADSETTNEEDCATGFVIKTLNSGDVAFTKSQNGAHQGTIRSDNLARTTFSGWLLFKQ